MTIEQNLNLLQTSCDYQNHARVKATGIPVRGLPGIPGNVFMEIPAGIPGSFAYYNFEF